MPIPGLSQITDALEWRNNQVGIGGIGNVGAIIRNPLLQRGVFSGFSPFRLISPGDDALAYGAQQPTDALAFQSAFRDAPWQGLAASSVADPLNYVGFGLPGKAAGGLGAGSNIVKALDAVDAAPGVIGNKSLDLAGAGLKKVAYPTVNTIGDAASGLGSALTNASPEFGAALGTARGLWSNTTSTWRELNRALPAYLLRNFIEDTSLAAVKGNPGASADVLRSIATRGPTRGEQIAQATGVELPKMVSETESLGDNTSILRGMQDRMGPSPVAPSMGLAGSPLSQASRLGSFKNAVINRVAPYIETNKELNRLGELKTRSAVFGSKASDELGSAANQFADHAATSGYTDSAQKLRDAGGLLSPQDLHDALLSEGAGPATAAAAKLHWQTAIEDAYQKGSTHLENTLYNFNPKRWEGATDRMVQRLRDEGADRVTINSLQNLQGDMTPGLLNDMLDKHGGLPDAVRGQLVKDWTNMSSDTRAEQRLAGIGRTLFTGYKWGANNTPAMMRASFEHPAVMNVPVTKDQVSDDYALAHGLHGLHGRLPIGPDVGGNQAYADPLGYLAWADILGAADDRPTVDPLTGRPASPEDDNGSGPAGSAFSALRDVGFGINPILSTALQMNGAYGRQAPSGILRPLGIANAALNGTVGNVTGPLDVEAPYKSTFGGPDQFPYLDYSVRKRVGELAAANNIDPSVAVNYDPRTVDIQRTQIPASMRPALPASDSTLRNIWQQARADVAREQAVKEVSGFLGVPDKLAIKTPEEQIVGQNARSSELLQLFSRPDLARLNPTAGVDSLADPLRAKIMQDQKLTPAEYQTVLRDPALGDLYFSRRSQQLHGR